MRSRAYPVFESKEDVDMWLKIIGFMKKQGRESLMNEQKKIKIKTELFKKGEHMELKELTEKTLEIFESKDTSELISKIKNVCIENKTEYFDRFAELVEDLSVDWLQKIFQCYEADRKERKQDYTPLSLARFVGRLAGEADTVIDMCAGSGALTIQKWSLDKNQEFMLYLS